MSSPYLEGLEFKEATPSIAPSIYENFQYPKKWRVLLAVGIGVCLIAVCALIFYLTAESRKLNVSEIALDDEPFHLANGDELKRWRDLQGQECAAANLGECPSEFGEKSVIVLAFGGLSGNQVDDIPALKELIRCGVTAGSLTPSYPSFSFLNLYSIATGLYPESHGIVGPSMNDSNIDSEFTLEKPSSTHVSEWWKGEPLWNTATKQAKRAATYLWPGSNIKIQERFPTFWENEKLVFGRRIRQLISWLQLPSDERPHLMMMFYEEPLVTAQKLGPLSEKIKNELRKINSGLDDLMAFLTRSNMLQCVDVIVVSDQGVAPSQCEDGIFLDDIINEDIPASIFYGPVGRIQFDRSAKANVLTNVLTNIQCQLPDLRVLTKEQVPIRYHYTNNDRIGDLILDTKMGSQIFRGEDHICTKGSNGYNILEEKMQGTFVAHGPSFKSDFATRSFRNIEVYNLICFLLNINPAPNNGTVGALDELLDDTVRPPQRKNEKVYLKEKLHSRPNRPSDDSQTIDCKCDGSHLNKPTTIASPTTTIPPETSSPIVVETTTSAVTTQETTSTSSTTTNAPTTTSTTQEPTTISTTTSEATSPSTSSEPTSTSTSSEATTTPLPSTSEVTSSTSNSSADSTTSITSSTTPSAKETDANLGIDDSTSSIAPETPDTSSDKEIYVHSPPLIQSTDIVTLIDSSEPPEQQNSTVSRRKRIVPLPLVKFVKNDNNKIRIEIKSTHCPWGCPKYFAPEVAKDTHNMLLHSHFVLGLPESLSLAIWSSFTLTKEYLDELSTLKPTLPEGVKLKSENLITKVYDGCWMADPRLQRSQSDQCSRSYQIKLYDAKNVSLRQLFPEELEYPDILKQEGFLLSNLAPFYNGFMNDGRRIMLQLLKKWTVEKLKLNILFGPVFDYDLNGLKDDISTLRNTIKPLVPSNYFYVVAMCNLEVTKFSKCPHELLEVYSFVFPNLDHSDKCLMSDEEYLNFHLTSLSDVENLTGLRFFRNIPYSQYLRLKTVQQLKLPILKL